MPLTPQNQETIRAMDNHAAEEVEGDEGGGVLAVAFGAGGGAVEEGAEVGGDGGGGGGGVGSGDLRFEI